MPTRLALKDVVLVVAILAVGGLVIASMVQEDRRFLQQRELIARIEALERSLSAGAARDAAPAPPVNSTDADWAREGVEIVRLVLAGRGPQLGRSTRVGGDLVEALESSPRTLTPLFATDAQARRVILDTVCQTLAECDGSTAVPTIARLATAYQVDPSGMWARVVLNPNARFSDGTPVTADDVRYSLEVLRQPGLDSQRVRGALDGIDSVEVISDRVAEFRFKEPRPLNVTHALCSLLILPRHFYERFTPEQLNRSTGLLMGSGPFKLRVIDPDNQWSPGSDIVLVRDPMAWEVSPAVDSIRFTVITDAAARLTALMNGDIHIMRPSAEQASPFVTSAQQPIARIEVHWRVAPSFSAIAWNCGERSGDPALTADRRVRTALTLLTDRDRVVQDFAATLAMVASSPFPPHSEMQEYGIEPLPFDPARAAALLDEAGWTGRNAEGVRTRSDGRALELDLLLPQGSRLAEFVGSMLKDEAAKVGARIDLITADMATIADMQRSGDFDGAVIGWSFGLPETEPRQQWHSASIGDGDNLCRFSNPDADRIIETGERTLDLSSRMELWNRLHRLLHDEQPCTLLVNPFWMRLISRRIDPGGTTFYGFDYSGIAFFVEPQKTSP